MKAKSKRKELNNHLNDVLNMYVGIEDEGHNEKHINSVVKRSLIFAEGYNDKTYTKENGGYLGNYPNQIVDLDMVKVIAIYHDGALAEGKGRDEHEKKSAESLRRDTVISNYFDHFDQEEIELMAQAIEDHRTSAKNNPRSIYGEIVSQADTSFDIEEYAYRCYLSRKNNTELKDIETKADSFRDHMIKKFGNNGKAYKKIFFSEADAISKAKNTMEKISNKENDEEIKKAFREFVSNVVIKNEGHSYSPTDVNNRFTVNSNATDCNQPFFKTIKF